MRLLPAAMVLLGLTLLAFAPQPVCAQQALPETSWEADLVINGQRVRVVQHAGGSACVVCGREVHTHDPVYVIAGQRVAVHGPGSPCDAAFRASPAKFLAALQPRGAFLGGQPGQISFGWFLFGTYVLLGLIFAGLCGQVALNRGHAPLRWFLAGLFFNAFAYAALLLKKRVTVNAPAGVPGGLGKIAATYAPVRCACGAENHPSASQCSACGTVLRPSVSSEVARAGQA